MSDSLATGALAGHYRIERELGQGGMATVYLAHDLKHDRDVAVKVLHRELGAVLGSDRFLAEIRTTARLQHPHILPLLDSGTSDGLLFYVMPLVTGETLRARLERERQLPVADAVRIATEVASALDYAHRQGVIHRDIKPENILLQDAQALVADFGIALAVQHAGGERMTQTGLSLGTPQYMSPEQAMGERSIDARSDVYAAGCVTYEMLAGEPPFTGPTTQAIVAKVMTERPAAVRVRRERVPAPVDAAVMTALEKLPADRFASAAEFARALGGASTAVTALVPGAAGAGVAPLARRLGSRPLAWAAALLLAGGITGWGVAWLARAPAGGEPLTITSIVPPSGGTFAERQSLALSPDGRKLAFVFAAGDGSRSLWLRRLDRALAEPIANTAGADAPFWSPDGRSLGYFAGGYLTVEDEDGDSRRLCPASDPRGGSWSRDGVVLFGDRAGITKVSAAGGTCRVIVPRDSTQLRPAFLPDGKRFLYSRGRSADMVAANLDGARIATLPLRAGEFSVVAPDFVMVPTPGDIRSVNAQRIDLHTLALAGPPVRLASDVRTSTGIPTVTFSATGAFAFLPATVDRAYLVYDASGLLRDTIRVEATWTVDAAPPAAGPARAAVAGTIAGLWLYTFDGSRATRLAVRDSAGRPGQSWGPAYPVFDPTGRRLAYMVMRPDGQCGIVLRELASEAERTLPRDPTAGAVCPIPLDWSPDGGRLLVRWDTTLAILGVNGSSPRATITRPGRIWEGRLSPDGRSVAYASDETGRAEVYAQPLGGGTPVRVSRDGGRWPRWGHGGATLTFLTPDGRVQLAAVDRAGNVGTPRTLFVVPTWRRSLFDDPGTGFAVVGDGERYIVRQSPSGLALSYVQHWPTLVHHADSSRAAAAQP